MLEIIIKIYNKIYNKISDLFIFIINKYIGKFVGRYTCPVCNKKIIKYKKFSRWYLGQLKKYKFIFDINDFETFNINNFSCPICNTSDSTRLYALYLRNALEKTKKEAHLLDIAPTRPLDKLIKSFENIKYRSADLYDENVDDKVDLVDMSIYEDNTFDFIICTHVLEHIEDDQRAISELYRILKFDCQAIIQVPIIKTINKDYEKNNAKSSAERWKHFGDGTHVRLYSSKGFVKKLEKVGFKVNILDVKYFGKNIFEQNQINKNSKLYIVKK